MNTAAIKRRFDTGAFYRECRKWHAYVSALAFAALMFFAITGIMLNHPEWFSAESTQKTTTITLRSDVLRTAQKQRDPAPALARAITAAAPIHGAYSSGEIVDGEAYLRFEGPKGASDAVVDLNTGRTELSVRKATLATLVGDLHRGKNSGAAWKWLIDVSAGLILTLSLIGFALFFSLRLRWRSNLIVSGIGLFVLYAVFWVSVS